MQTPIANDLRPDYGTQSGATTPANQPYDQIPMAMETPWLLTPDDVEASLAQIQWTDKERTERRRNRRTTLLISIPCVLLLVWLLYYFTSTGAPPHAFLTIAVILVDLILLWVDFIPYAVFLGSTVFLALAGCVDRRGALEGFSNPGVLAIGALLALARAAYDSGFVSMVMRQVLGKASGVRSALMILFPPLLLVSAFLNNTPVVAILIPELRAWGQRCGIPIGKLLMPLSFVSILGGGLTLIGSSINIIAASVASQIHGGPKFVPIFSLFPIGACQALLGCIYLLAMEPLLPEGPSSSEVHSQRSQAESGSQRMSFRTMRSYTVTFRVEQGSSLVGVSAIDGGVTRVSGVLSVTSVTPAPVEEGKLPEMVKLEVGSLLTVEAVAMGVVALRRLPGLSFVPPEDGSLTLAGLSEALGRWPRRRHRVLVEAIAGSRCRWLIGSQYEGAVPLAISGGKKSLSAGDCVLVECFPRFATAYGALCEHFTLLAPVPDSKPPRTHLQKDRHRAYACGAVMFLMMLAAALDVAPLVFIVCVAVAALVGLQCVKLGEAWAAVDGKLLCTIAAAFGVSNAMQQSGAADLGAKAISGLCEATGGSRLGLMIVVYIVVAVMSSLVSSNAVVVLMMPVVFSTKAQSDPLGPALPYALLVIFAASANFATPFAYQTNMMVWEPGGYTFGDFVRIGSGLQLVCLVVAVTGCYLTAEYYPPEDVANIVTT
eukprot:Hpha_TRINITY_DN12948_c0_g1::TRINITY_DN12948_c0_g1_i1::g.164543::m.164543